MVLADIKAGTSAQIVDITQVSALVRRRLVDLDIMEGTIVRIKKSCRLADRIHWKQEVKLSGLDEMKPNR
ncbi:ferrous iron transport protein A [Brevibacillus laterosporus]